MGNIKGLMERPYVGKYTKESRGRHRYKGRERKFCYSEERSCKLLGNTDTFLQDYMAPHPRRLHLNTFCCKVSGLIREMVRGK
jgi:hypothetical protein